MPTLAGYTVTMSNGKREDICLEEKHIKADTRTKQRLSGYVQTIKKK